MILKKYCDFVIKNKDIQYSVSFESLPPVSALHKFVGAQAIGENIYGIPNDMNAVLKYVQGVVSYLGETEDGVFKWTGGCIWNGSLYAFPRKSSHLLKMSLNTEIYEYISVGEEYLGEHHYGGICTKDGVIYQPPRDSDHILIWDLKTKKIRKLYLNQEGKKLRYCGSILLPDGHAYFLPEIDEKVIKLDTRTEKWSYIGERINAMVFDAKVAIDGNIYGFSAYCDGLLKINVKTDCVYMIHEEIHPGAYGTKLGVNGHLYSIPGDGAYIWDYDPMGDSINSIYKIPSNFKARYAGGTSIKNGDIYAMPAREHKILRLKADGMNLEIPDDLYDNYFRDCY